jgi:hypothetical protein
VAAIAGGKVRLFRVDPVAPRLVEVPVADPTPQGDAVALSISGGRLPTVCAVFAGRRRVVACHVVGGNAWETLSASAERHRTPDRVAVSYDGDEVAFTSVVPPDAIEAEPDVYVANRIGGGQTIRVRPRAEPLPSGYCCGIAVEHLGWAGDDTLLLSEGRESDDGTVMRRVVLGRDRYWAEAPVVPVSNADRRAGYTVFEGAVSPAIGTRVLAVQRGYDLADDAPTRAVFVGSYTGKVEEVVSVPERGRWVSAVSGGDLGVLYRTEGESGPRVYWRRPGEAHGRRLGGLPRGATYLVAQA